MTRVVICSTIVVLLLFSSCRKKMSQAGTQFSNAEGKFRLTLGHEALTYYALAYASYFTLDPKRVAFFNIKGGIPSADQATNSFLKGNYATDWGMPRTSATGIVFPDLWNHYLHYIPDANVVEGKPLSRIPWPTGLAWQGDQRLSALHFLRRIADGKATGFLESCRASRNTIQYAADMALYEWQRRPEVAKMWMGSALHTIQDSYSPEHTLRTKPKLQADSGEDANVGFALDGGVELEIADAGRLERIRRLAETSNPILNICVYEEDDRTFAGACRHDFDKINGLLGDTGDSIWKRVSGPVTIDNMTDLAAASIWTSEVFLQLIYDQGVQRTQKAQLDAFFASYLNCGDLVKKPVQLKIKLPP